MDSNKVNELIKKAKKNNVDAFDSWLGSFDADLQIVMHPEVELSPAPFYRVDQWIFSKLDKMAPTFREHKAILQFFLDYADGAYGRARASCYVCAENSPGLDWNDDYIAEFSVIQADNAILMHRDLVQTCFRFAEIIGLDCVIFSQHSEDQFSVEKLGGVLKLHKINKS